MGKGFGIGLSSVIKGQKGFKILPDNGAKNVIILIVVWENPNPNTKYVTQPRTPIIVTSIDVPFVLVKDKSNTREASSVTLGRLRWDDQRTWRVPL
jgi:hypothetical protein